MLGKGAFGDVWMVKDNDENVYALKKINRHQLKREP